MPDSKSTIIQIRQNKVRESCLTGSGLEKKNEARSNFLSRPYYSKIWRIFGAIGLTVSAPKARQADAGALPIKTQKMRQSIRNPKKLFLIKKAGRRETPSFPPREACTHIAFLSTPFTFQFNSQELLHSTTFWTSGAHKCLPPPPPDTRLPRA